MDIQNVILTILNKEEAKAEYNQLKGWKEETAENLKLYQEINKIVEEGKNLSEYKEYNVESAYERFKRQINKPTRSWFAYAAAALIVLVGGYFLFSTKNVVESVVPQTYIASNAIAEHSLKDGSTITLNHGAEVKELTDFSKVRKVDLKGEAFFDIASDQNKPFRIMLEENTFVEVLGTSFNIINNEDALQVVVESGHVELHVDEKVISLTKGYAAERVNGSIVKFKKNVDNYLSWKNNTLTYKNTPITDVFEEISSHFGASFSISDAVKSSDCNLTSTFNTESLDQILNELSKVVELSFTKRKDGSYSIKDIKCE